MQNENDVWNEPWAGYEKFKIYQLRKYWKCLSFPSAQSVQTPHAITSFPCRAAVTIHGAVITAAPLKSFSVFWAEGHTRNSGTGSFLPSFCRLQSSSTDRGRTRYSGMQLWWVILETRVTPSCPTQISHVPPTWCSHGLRGLQSLQHWTFVDVLALYSFHFSMQQLAQRLALKSTNCPN